MENIGEVTTTLRREIKGSLDDVTKAYLSHFDGDIERFVELLGTAFLDFRNLDTKFGAEDRRNVVVALVYCSINLQVISMKLLISGYIVAAGNIQRQVLESMALALLCSVKKLKVLDEFLKERYSTSKAIDHALNNFKTIGAKKDALQALKDSKRFYDKYSHPTGATLISYTSATRDRPGLYVGASFDPGKLEIYKAEIEQRLSLVNVFPSYIRVVNNNLSGW